MLIAVASQPVDQNQLVALNPPADQSPPADLISLVNVKWAVAMGAAIPAASQSGSIPSINRLTQSPGESKNCSGWTNAANVVLGNVAASHRQWIVDAPADMS